MHEITIRRYISNVWCAPRGHTRHERRRSVNPLSATMQTVTNSNSNNDEPGQLHGHWLIVARIAWIMCVALTLVIFFASLPEYSAQLHTPCSDLTCACLPPVPQWAVRTSLDTLGLSRFSHWACPDGFRGACLSSLCTDWRAHHTRVFERVGVHCDRPNLPLPAPFQSASTAADKMGGLRHRCVDYCRCERDCTDPDFPDGSFA